jgi:hypothetical protein
MGQSYSQYQGRDYPAGQAPFRVAETLGPQPVPHGDLDALRMNWRRTPEAQYPDGYLGTINTRRQDRILNGLKERESNRPYTRGIHKGERINGRDYFWPMEFNLSTGLEAQARGERFSPPGLGSDLQYERYPTDRKVGPKRVPIGGQSDGTVQWGTRQNADRIPMLRMMAPGWSSAGPRGNPGFGIAYVPVGH